MSKMQSKTYITFPGESLRKYTKGIMYETCPLRNRRKSRLQKMKKKSSKKNDEEEIDEDDDSEEVATPQDN